MTNDERNEQIDALLDEVVGELVARGLVNGEVSAWRALITKGLFELPRLLCPHHLKESLEKYHRWLEHDIAELQQEVRH